MNRRKVYYFEQPKMPGCMNVAVCPCLSPIDGRLVFEVPGSMVWRLTGKLIQDGEDKFIFQCDDKVMGARGGTYYFSVLDIKTMRGSAKRWIAAAEEIGQACNDTNDLHYWYRKNYPPNHLQEIYDYEMRQRKRKGKESNF